MDDLWACCTCGHVGRDFHTVTNAGGDCDVVCNQCDSDETDELPDAFRRVVQERDSMEESLSSEILKLRKELRSTDARLL